MKKVLFIDRDGTILNEPEDEQVDSFEKFSFLRGVITSLSKIAAETDYELVWAQRHFLRIHSGLFKTRCWKS
jgi:imidazoleglycerol-phosphate dehydratase/histidinol-phosphatase